MAPLVLWGADTACQQIRSERSLDLLIPMMQKIIQGDKDDVRSQV